MIPILTVLAIGVALYAVEQYFVAKPWKTEDAHYWLLNIIICLLFSIFLLLLAAVIKYTYPL